MDLRSQRVLPWSLRGIWALQALAAGPAFAAALGESSTFAARVTEVAASV